MLGFEGAVRGGPPILTDGGIETRLMFETDVPLPPYIEVAALVGDPVGGPVLRRIYESYVAAARPSGLPVILGTPTFRAQPQLRPASRAGRRRGGAAAQRVGGGYAPRDPGVVQPVPRVRRRGGRS
jgi:hypothetical protein